MQQFVVFMDMMYCAGVSIANLVSYNVLDDGDADAWMYTLSLLLVAYFFVYAFVFSL
jgi:hypothetical protein